MEHQITEKEITGFRKYLMENEKSEATMEKYLHEIRNLSRWLDGRPLHKTELIAYREILKDQYQPVSVNGKLSAIHAYLKYIGLEGMRLRFLKVQNRIFLEETKELTEQEYRKVLEEARRQKDERMYYLIMTLCGTGIRISELKFITVRAVQEAKAMISLKGKNRIILIPGKLQRQLLDYIKRKHITEGCVFVTRTGKAMDRSNICHRMKALGRAAKVEVKKIFPHNLRHLFARTFYQIEKNLVYLADLLGHSSIETTRIYVAASMREHEALLNKMKLVF